MLQAIAIDDEPIALEVIKSLASEITFMKIKACFTNAVEAIAYLKNNPVDLLFLDIKMPGISGIDLLKTIHPQLPVIFTTAYSEHAVQSFELDAIDYLLKPFSAERFLKACNKANQLIQLKKAAHNNEPVLPAVFVKSGYEQVCINLSDVLYVESIGNYVRFELTNQNIISRMTMGEAELLLPASAFIRIHRSFIIAKKQIIKTDKKTVWVGQKELPIGAAYSQEIEDLIMLNRKHQ